MSEISKRQGAEDVANAWELYLEGMNDIELYDLVESLGYLWDESTSSWTPIEDNFEDKE